MRTLPSLFVLATLAACSGDKNGTDTGTDTDTDTDTTTPPACTVMEGSACVLEGTLLDDTTLTADVPWLLRSVVVVGDDSNAVTLTIEPGTTVYGESATNGLLVITRGARIMAEGTADAPIRFTSDQPEGSRARGDWGGIAINGRGVINGCAAGVNPCEAEGEGGTGTYGGNDNDDDSGVLRYVVIEFGGTEISPDNEVNGLGLQGVGSGTQIDHVQIHRNLDDGIEFWGGAVSVKHLVVTAPGDDGIDWDFGWVGKIQFAVVHQADDAGNMGTECDSNPDDHLATPISNPTLSNITYIGSEQIAEDNYGMLYRRGAAPKLHNIAVDRFSSGCLAIRDQATFDAFESGTASIDHVIMACGNPFEEDPEETEIGTEEGVFASGTGNQNVADLGLTNLSIATPDWRPQGSSVLLGAGQAPSDPWFDAASYVGGFDAGDTWADGWTTTAAN